MFQSSCLFTIVNHNMFRFEYQRCIITAYQETCEKSVSTQNFDTPIVDLFRLSGPPDNANPAPPSLSEEFCALQSDDTSFLTRALDVLRSHADEEAVVTECMVFCAALAQVCILGVRAVLFLCIFSELVGVSIHVAGTRSLDSGKLIANRYSCLPATDILGRESVIISKKTKQNVRVRVAQPPHYSRLSCVCVSLCAASQRRHAPTAPLSRRSRFCPRVSGRWPLSR